MGTAVRFILTTGLALAALSAPDLGSAQHELSIAHQPPPLAAQDQILVLEVAVASTCAPFCSAVIVEAHYLDIFGVPAVVSASTTDFSPGGAVALAIPAGDVLGPSFEYRIEARQRRCVFAYDCHDIAASAPAEGSFSVPVRPLFLPVPPVAREGVS